MHELSNLLSVAFRHAREPVLEYSFGVLSYSFAPFFVCLLGPWFAVASLSKTALSGVDDFLSDISRRNVTDILTQFFINSGRNRRAEISPTFSHNFSSIQDQTDLQKSHRLFDAIFIQFSFNSSELCDATFIQFVLPADSIR
jgi:hypothetical protein